MKTETAINDNIGTDFIVSDFFEQLNDTERSEVAELLIESVAGVPWKCDELIAKLQAAKSVVPA